MKLMNHGNRIFLARRNGNISRRNEKCYTNCKVLNTVTDDVNLKQKEPSKTPIIQPFSSDEEKTPVHVRHLLK